jgi:hypothetical protein
MKHPGANGSNSPFTRRYATCQNNNFLPDENQSIIYNAHIVKKFIGIMVWFFLVINIVVSFPNPNTSWYYYINNLSNEQISLRTKIKDSIRRTYRLVRMDIDNSRLIERLNYVENDEYVTEFSHIRLYEYNSAAKILKPHSGENSNENRILFMYSNRNDLDTLVHVDGDNINIRLTVEKMISYFYDEFTLFDKSGNVLFSIDNISGAKTTVNIYHNEYSNIDRMVININIAD